MGTAMETVEELDWVLDQLESMQTQRAVSDMASNKVSPFFIDTSQWVPGRSNPHGKAI